MVAFANSGGRHILVGVNDDGSIASLLASDIGRLNQLISNVASQSVHSLITDKFYLMERMLYGKNAFPIETLLSKPC